MVWAGGTKVILVCLTLKLCLSVLLLHAPHQGHTAVRNNVLTWRDFEVVRVIYILLLKQFSLKKKKEKNSGFFLPNRALQIRALPSETKNARLFCKSIIDWINLKISQNSFCLYWVSEACWAILSVLGRHLAWIPSVWDSFPSPPSLAHWWASPLPQLPGQPTHGHLLHLISAGASARFSEFILRSNEKSDILLSISS